MVVTLQNQNVLLCQEWESRADEGRGMIKRNPARCQA